MQEYLKIIHSEEQNLEKNETERRKPTQLWDEHTHTHTHTNIHILGTWKGEKEGTESTFKAKWLKTFQDWERNGFPNA